MEFFDRVCDESMKSLINLGRNGHFPLFDEGWINEINSHNTRKFSINEKSKIKTILKRMAKHKNFERKRTIIFSLKEEDRRLFLRAFLTRVEGQIIDSSPELH